MARTIGASRRFYARSFMNFDALRTLSFVMFFAFAGAFPNAKLILCSRSSSSVTGVRRDVSSSFCNSGSVLMCPRKGFLSAMIFCCLSLFVQLLANICDPNDTS